MEPERTALQSVSLLSADAARRLEVLLAQLGEQLPSQADSDEPILVRLLEDVEQHEYPIFLAALLDGELRFRVQQGETPDASRYLRLFPDHENIVNEVFAGHTQNTRSMEATISLTRTHTPGKSRVKADASAPPDIAGYEFLERIGQGGMGTVWKARHAALNRLVAIKMPLAVQVASDQEHERFMREARSSAGLQHTNICPIYDVAEADGRPYLAMAYIEGDTLKVWARREKPSPRQSAEMVAVLAKAVDYAHQHQIVHRDLKPSNVMVDRESGKPVLMDFGLAKNASEDDVQLTQSGQVIGTPAYMSPEQAAGRGDQVGPATDVYALGAILYELLAGRPPFVGRAGEVIHQVQSQPPAPLGKLVPKLHRDLETICIKAMEKDPTARYASATALAEDLDRFCQGEAIQARREGIAPKLWRFLRRHQKAAAAFLLVAVLAIAAVVYFASGEHSARQVSRLTTEWNEGLQAEQWDHHHLQRMEALIQRIQEREQGPQQSERRRERLYEALTQHIRRREIGREVIEEDQVARIEETIDLLTERSPSTARQLRAELQDRLRQWQPVFHLAAPFDSLDKYIHPWSKGVQIRDQHLVATTAKPGDAALIYTRLKSVGNIRLTAEFAGKWFDAGSLGLLLNAKQKRGYLLRIRARQRSDQQSSDDSFVSLAENWDRNDKCSVEILRDGVLLFKQLVPARECFEKRESLRLTAERTGSRLSLQVGKLPPVSFDDIFPITAADPGLFALFLPPEAELVSLTAQRQALPVSASPLEEGDELFAAGDFAEALLRYEKLAGGDSDQDIQNQARYKSALCCIQLKQVDRAAQLLESLIAGKDQQIAPLAICRYWLLLLEQSRYDEAEAVYENLSTQYRFEQLAAMVPQQQRDLIIGKMHGMAGGFRLFQVREEHMRHLQRAVAVEELLGSSMHVPEMRYWPLLRCYHILGKNRLALKLAKSQIDQMTLQRGPVYYQHIDEYCWLLRQEGRHQDALAEINDHFNRSSSDPLSARLLIERARIHVGLEQWQQAREDIERYFTAFPWDPNYRSYSSAKLIHGFLLHNEGKPEEAKQVWKSGRLSTWFEKLENKERHYVTGMESENAVLLAGLSGDMTSEELSHLFMNSQFIKSASVFAGIAKQQSHVLLPAIRQMAARPEDLAEIERLAFQQCSLREYIQTPVILLAVQITRNGAAPGQQWSPQQQTLIRQLFTISLEEYRLGKLSPIQFAQLLATWKGVSNLVGWGGLAPTLNPSIRGPAAYLFGFRYRRRGNPQEATRFFQQALDDAQPDSLLARLAEAELKNVPAQP